MFTPDVAASLILLFGIILGIVFAVPIAVAIGVFLAVEGLKAVMRALDRRRG